MFLLVSQAPSQGAGGPYIAPQVFGTSYMRAQSRRNDKQILQGDLNQGGICGGGVGDGGHILVTEFRGTALNTFVLMCYGHVGLLHLAPLTDFTYKYHHDLSTN